MTELGDTIRALRESRHLFQTGLASEIGYHHSAISRYESGKYEVTNINKPLLQALETYFYSPGRPSGYHCPPGHLINIAEKEKAEAEQLAGSGSQSDPEHEFMLSNYDTFIDELDTLRKFRELDTALSRCNQVDDALAKLARRQDLKPVQQKRIQRWRCKVAIVRVTCITGMFSGDEAKVRVAKDLSNIMKWRAALHPDTDTYYRQSAVELQLAVLNLWGDYEAAKAGYDQLLERKGKGKISDEVVLSCIHRDRLVIPGKQGNYADYLAAVRRTQAAIDSGVFSDKPCAKIIAGQAITEYRLGKYNDALMHLEEAQSHYRQAELENKGGGFTQIQLQLTAFKVCLIPGRFDEPLAVQRAQTVLNSVKSGGFSRYNKEVQLILRTQQFSDKLRQLVQ